MKNAAVGSYPVPTGSGGMGAEPGMVFQLMGILISKSVVVIGLTAWTIIRQNFAVRSADGLGAQSDREESGCEESGCWYVGSRQRNYSGRYGGSVSGDGGQYLDGLTVGISIFSVLSALECMDSGKDDFKVALRLVFLLLLLVSYYISLFFYRKKMHDREHLICAIFFCAGNYGHKQECSILPTERISRGFCPRNS